VSAKACSSVVVVVVLGVAPWSRSKRVMDELWHLTAASSGHRPMLPVAFTSHLPPGRGSACMHQPASAALLVSKGEVVPGVAKDEERW
jgi:hypothetical protein